MEENDEYVLLWPHSKMCKTWITTGLLMDAQLNVVHNKMSAGCTVKCDPGMNLSNGAEELLFIM